MGGHPVTRRSDLLTTTEAARYVRLSRRTLENYRVTGQGPKFLKVGRLVFYRLRDLDEWLENTVRRSTSDPGPEPKPKKRTARRPKGRTLRPPSDPGSEPPNS